MEVDPAQLGRFEVVLFLGVLYHLRDPLPALERVHDLTDGVAVIETEAIEVLGAPGSSILDFTEGDQLRHDHTNWFVPTRAALHAMCRAAGFARVETRLGPPSAARQLRGALGRARNQLRGGRWWTADGRGAAVGDIALQRYRVTVHAFS
jgi:tRNA (mo5U34)-methyltransferase